MSDKEKNILSEINHYKRKSIISLVLKGLIISLAAVLFLFIIINYLEYSFQFGIAVRACLFFSFLTLSTYLLIRYVVLPLSKLFRLEKAIDNETAAREIGIFFPEIRDKLLNIIQLRNYGEHGSTLATAGIDQKIESLPHVQYSEAVNYVQNRKLLPWLAVPFVLFVSVISIQPEIFTESTERITNYNKDFVPKAPFSFELLNDELLAFKNEDFTIRLGLSGDAIPESVYLINGGRKLKMVKKNDEFEYTMKTIKSPGLFNFEAAGFESEKYKLNLLNRPDLRSFNMYLNYPTYLDKDNELLKNVGNTQIPEGTKVKWQLNTMNSVSVALQFSSDSTFFPFKVVDEELFEVEKIMTFSDSYQFILSNEHSNNKDPIQYQIEVNEDQFPKIENSSYQDTILYSFVSIGGNISDDYGLTRLTLNYSLDNSNYHRVNIPIDRKQSSQRYYYQWKIDSLVSENQELTYFLQVWDNDGFNGRKSSKTGVYKFNIPTQKEVKESIDKVAEQTESNIDKTLKEAKELKDELEEAERKIKGKKELNWQDDKLIKDLIKRKDELNQAIEDLKEQNRNNETKRERFSKQDEKIKEKVDNLQKLMDELLDDETKKLYDELKKLLEDQSQIEDIQDLIEKINNKESNLEQELERTLELFKRMKVEFQLNENLNDLKEQIEEQKELRGETLEKETPNEELAENQEELNEKFEEFKDKMEQLEESNQDLKQPESLPDLSEEQESIQQSQEQSKQLLENNKNKKAGEQQQKSIKQMQKMAEKMEQMQAGMEMQAMQENLEDLRAIVHNLIQLSFDQETLMNEFSAVKQSDPRFVELSQKQLKLKDDSQIVQDSLLALANRVFQIASFVTREVTDMNEHMDKSVEFIRDRRKSQAVAEQQFAMTSMNNLALLLDDVLQQMQNAMADAMGKPQKSKGKQQTPSLGELQKQLNDKIDQLKGSGKKGRALSEELAQLAAEQERIRKALEEAQQKIGEKDGGNTPGSGIPKKMEETEKDLVNKQITEETIRRQKEILTRLLEAEDALREKELDQERKGETANDYDKNIPNAFEEYFKLKEQEIELLKTIPPKLYPYYKKEVTEYFKRIGNESTNKSE